MEEKKDMIKWNELDSFIGKPVFDKDNDAWRILRGYQRIGNDCFVRFTDNCSFEEVDMDCTNLFMYQ